MYKCGKKKKKRRRENKGGKKEFLELIGMCKMQIIYFIFTLIYSRVKIKQIYVI